MVWEDSVKAQVASIAKAIVVDVSSVASFYYAAEKQLWDLDDFPNIAPPWRSFFLEWKCPTEMVLESGRRQIEKGNQLGLLCSANICEGNWKQKWPKEYLTALKVDAHPDIKWIISTAPWMIHAGKPMCGTPCSLGLQTIFLVDSQGKPLAFFHTGPLCNDTKDVSAESYHMLLLSLCFINCKNTQLCDNTKETNASRPQARRSEGKIPKLIFKTLEISPMARTLSRTASEESVSVQRAMHICRGHFATYTETNPLFGRYTGTFWRPMHTRGNMANGAVIKDYATAAAAVRAPHCDTSRVTPPPPA